MPTINMLQTSRIVPVRLKTIPFRKVRFCPSWRQAVRVLTVFMFILAAASVAHAQAEFASVEGGKQVEATRWAVVVYSSVRPDKAEAAARRFRRQLPDQQIDVLVTTNSRNAPYRVAIGPFPSSEKAREARNSLKGLPHDAWLWEVPASSFVLNHPLAPKKVEHLAVALDETKLVTGGRSKGQAQPRSRESRNDAGAQPDGAAEITAIAVNGQPAATQTTVTQTTVTQTTVTQPATQQASSLQEEDDGQASTGQADTMQAAVQRPRQHGGNKRIDVIRLNAPMKIDGVLSEQAWQAAGSRDFKQRSPKNGAPPSEQTEVWVAYDARALYVAARCYDRDPSRISRTIGRRDSEIEADWFSVSIDTYRDRRTGFFFQVTSGGSVKDGVIYDEVRTDESWNGVWESHTSIDSLGWSVEMRIPFTQLRFDAEQDVWGVNFARQIEHTNELVDFVAPRGRKVTFFADLAGLKGIRAPRQIEVMPYVVVQAETYEGDDGNPFLTGRDFGSHVGGDVKVRLGPSISIDGTINPDFGQVEVDPAVVNLTAQETFFEEKRPFFLDDAPLFDFGRDRGMRFFHSRRIGQSPRGNPIHQGSSDIPEETGILGAVKLAGKVNEKWTVGWMNVVTAREYARVDSAGVRFRDEVAPLTLYDVVRVRREKNEGNQAIGFFASGVVRDLQAQQLQPILNKQAFVGGIDGWTFFGKRNWWALEGAASFSRVNGDTVQIRRLQQSVQRYFQRPDAAHLSLDSSATSLSGATGQLRLRKRGGDLQMNAGIKFITPGFELNDLGFLRQADRLTGDLTFLYGQWQQGGILNRGFVGFTMSQDYDFNWTHLRTNYSIFGRGQFTNFWDAYVNLTISPKGLDVVNTRGGPSMLAPAGWNGSASVSTNSSKRVFFSVSGNASQDEEGSWSYGIGPSVTWRPSPKLTFSLAPWWSASLWDAGFFTSVEDPLAVNTYGIRTVFASLQQDFFSTDLRLNWTFTPTLSLQTYFQLYVADVQYDGFKELALPATYDFTVYGEDGSTITARDENGTFTVDPDGQGPAPSFSFSDADFNFASLRGTTVLRWEYRKGSALYLAWTHDRFVQEDLWQQPDGGLLGAAPFNKFVFKLTYWFDM